MMLRSSSTPVLGSLLSSVSDNSNNHHNHYETSSPFRHYCPSTSFLHNHNRLSFHPSPGSVHLSTTVSCGSSAISLSVGVDQFSEFDFNGFHRIQSEGNLEGLVWDNNEEFYKQNNQSKKLSARNRCSRLKTIPSFSLYNSKARCEEEEEEDDNESDIEEEEEEELNENDKLLNTFSMENLLLTEEVKVAHKTWNVVGQEMFLPRGLGTDGGNNGGVSGGGSSGGGGGGGEFNPNGPGGDGGDNHEEVEEYYKRMVEENPGNPLFLGNYAKFLYQSTRDLQGAEEYFSRANLADPGDGENLSQYAKLVWELHHDKERASSYFKRAAQASPQDSNVHAAYASFLWETEEDTDEPSEIESPLPPQFH